MRFESCDFKIAFNIPCPSFPWLFGFPWLILSKELPWLFWCFLCILQRICGFGRERKSLVELRGFLGKSKNTKEKTDRLDMMAVLNRFSAILLLSGRTKHAPNRGYHFVSPLPPLSHRGICRFSGTGKRPVIEFYGTSYYFYRISSVKPLFHPPEIWGQKVTRNGGPQFDPHRYQLHPPEPRQGFGGPNYPRHFTGLVRDRVRQGPLGGGGVAATPLRHPQNCGKSHDRGVATPWSATGGCIVCAT